MLLLLASHNPNKKKEIAEILPEGFEIKDLLDLKFEKEIIESGSSLEENALIKVRFLHTATGLNCIAEDSGLEVFALNNEPGIYSARYAGLQKNDLDNIQLLLKNMQHIVNRDAQFRTVIACVFEKKEYLFEGIIKGHIAQKPVGEDGFGYDPIFIPIGYNESFAELGLTNKSKISHRSLAVQKLIAFLKGTPK